MAGYGLQLWPILQDMHQLKATYGERAGRFMSNAGVIQRFGVNDHATAGMLSRTIGDTTIEYDTVSTSRGTGWGDNRAGPSESISGHISARRLATPDEIMRMRPDQLLLLRQGERPLVVEKSAIMISANMISANSLACLIRLRQSAKANVDTSNRTGLVPRIVT